MSEELLIDALGAQGDGVAHADGEPLYVPFTLPGERVLAERTGARARLTAVLDASAERRAAPCPHFGDCGGCDLQHASETLYRRFKRERLTDAFAARGLAPKIDDVVPCAPATRRRVILTGARRDGEFRFGFHAALSDRIVAVAVCPVADPAIAGRLADLGKLASLLAPRRGEVRVTVTATSAGLDVSVRDAARLDERLRREALGLALRRDFARLTVDGEVVVENRAPAVAVAGARLVPPPGGFLQAVASAESAMTDLVAAHLGAERKIADLFAGVGTFALRLARQSAVHAAESDADALTALDRACRATTGLRPVATERRDLFRRPLTARDLAAFGGAVFDPPRAGAEAQSRELAASRVRKIAAVSCNPATLARDCRILVDGGYRIGRVVPIDQFLWSHHVEAVALLER